MTDELSFAVSADEADERLDRLVARRAGVSRRIARIWIGEGRVRVGSRVSKILSRTVRAGAKVTIRRGGAEQQQSSIELLHLDRYVVAVNKPAGLLSETDRQGSPSLEIEVPALLKEQGERRLDLWLVHRLDAGTSGVVVLTRRPMATRLLSAAFASGEVHKEYLALCAGTFESGCDVDEPIGRQEGVRQAVRADGKSAQTRFESIATSERASLVRALPKTGRTHQIRVHLAHLGHPILGDRLYGGPGYTWETPPEAIGRPMLHAHRLQFKHPKTGESLELEVSAPADFLELAKRLSVWC